MLKKIIVFGAAAWAISRLMCQSKAPVQRGKPNVRRTSDDHTAPVTAEPGDGDVLRPATQG